MKSGRLSTSLSLALLLPVLVAAQSQRPEAPPAADPGGQRVPAVVLDGRELQVPVTITPAGPMVALQPLAPQLEGDLVPDAASASFTLRLGDTPIVVGLGSPVITVGESIVSLSQPPVMTDVGLMVPLDFLQKTFGDVAGYSFEWRPEAARLTIGRRSARDLRVLLDVVHLQGMTTVVLQFPEQPRYRIEELPRAVEVQVLGDRLTPPPPRAMPQGALVEGVTIEPQRIVLQLALGAEADSYILQNPFRLVFDVHQPSEVVTPSGPTFPTPELETGVRTIVLDPGHGGSESGAVGPSGAQEKELTLALAEALAARLQQRLGVRVVLTRSADASLALDARTAIANQNKADLFISIHLNSSRGSGAHGAETYFLSAQATDPGAARSAAAENAPQLDALDANGQPLPEDPLGDLQLILWDLAQTHHLAESQRFATLVQAELNQALQLRDRGVKQAPFRVLMGAAMPAVLVELGFLSNPDEEGKLQTPEYRAELVEALVRAVSRYKALVENRPADGAAQVPVPGRPRPSGPAPTPPPTPGAAPGGAPGQRPPSGGGNR